MFAETLSAIGSAVTGAIRQAAQVTGTGFSYLLATAKIESGLDPKIKALTSSATGLFQFIEQTWLATMKQSGSELGYGRYANAIEKTASGRYIVRDPATRAEILNLRKDATANAAMAGAFTRQNAVRLKAKLGRDPTEGELYIAHFLGAGGAGKLISAAAKNPNVTAAQLFPRAAAANRSIFYDKQGGARSVSGVYGLLVTKLARAMPSSPSSPRSPQVAQAPSITATRTIGAAPNVLSPTLTADVSPVIPMPPLAASIAPLMVPPPSAASVAATSSSQMATLPAQTVTALAPADDGQVFYDLFRTEGRGAVSHAVSELWGARTEGVQTTGSAIVPSASVASGSDVSRGPARGFDLFRSAGPQT